MALQLRLPPAQIADLVRIREIPKSELALLVESVAAVTAHPLRYESLKKLFETRLPEQPPSHVESLARQLLQLRGLVRQRDIAVSEVVAAIPDAIRVAGTAWSTAEIDKWFSISDELIGLIGCPPVRMVSSALDLSYDYANLLQTIRVITDIRPIFSESADSIDGAVVTYTLRLKYDSRDGDHSLSIAVDTADIRRLLDQCVRALKKAEVADAWVRSSHTEGIPSIISGDQG